MALAQILPSPDGQALTTISSPIARFFKLYKINGKYHVQIPLLSSKAANFFFGDYF